MMSRDSTTSNVRAIVEEGMIQKVGRGNSILFWHDSWCDCGPLKGSFPRLFLLSMQRYAFINQVGEWHVGQWSWKLRWRRALYDWEIEEANTLERLIEQHCPQSEVADGVCWRGSTDVAYPMKRIAGKLHSPSPPTPILPKSALLNIWKNCVPPRAKLTLWLANLERLKTGDLLVEKGIIDAQQALCPFCNLAMESNSHALLLGVHGWRS